MRRYHEYALTSDFELLKVSVTHRYVVTYLLPNQPQAKKKDYTLINLCMNFILFSNLHYV